MSRRSKKVEAGRGWSLVRSCPRCGQSEDECRCDSQASSESGEAPRARLRIEKRRGKSVSVVAVKGAPDDDLRTLLRDLKGLCACGGTLREGSIEIQGDQRQTVMRLLEEAGFRPVLAGG